MVNHALQMNFKMKISPKQVKRPPMNFILVIIFPLAYLEFDSKEVSITVMNLRLHSFISQCFCFYSLLENSLKDFRFIMNLCIKNFLLPNRGSSWS